MFNIYIVIGSLLLWFATPRNIGGYEIALFLQEKTKEIVPSNEGLTFRSILYNVAVILTWPLLLPVFHKLNKHKF